MIGFNEGTGEPYVKSGAFKFDPDCSVHRDEPLERNGLSHLDLIRDPQNVILALRVGDLKDADMSVQDSPWPRGRPDEPYQVAHASVLKEQLSDRAARRRMAELADIHYWPRDGRLPADM